MQSARSLDRFVAGAASFCQSICAGSSSIMLLVRPRRSKRSPLIAADNDAQLERAGEREREREAEQLRKQTTPRATKRTNYANQFRMQHTAGGLGLLLDGAANVP